MQVKYPTPAWRLREMVRFDSGKYTKTPWFDIDRFPDHFAHVSTEDSSKVAFTASPRHGADDRQTRMRPGKYLSRYYGDILDETFIRHYAELFASLHEKHILLFATTPSQIEHVYTHGPASCMSYEADNFDSSVHPTRVYGAGDLALAYLDVPDEDGEHITARCLCFPERLHRSRIYGDESRLEPLLVTRGYTYGSFNGARLLKILNNESYVVPYMDHCMHAGDNGKYLVIGTGNISLRQTEGLSGNLFYCPNCCEHRGAEDDSVWIEGQQERWCEPCSDRYSLECECCCNRFASDEVTHCPNLGDWGESICVECLNTFIQCDDCNEWSEPDNAESVGGEIICKHCVALHYSNCDGCNTLEAKGDLDEDNNCDDCILKLDEISKLEREKISSVSPQIEGEVSP